MSNELISYWNFKRKVLENYVDKYRLIRLGNVDGSEANATHITGLFYVLCKMYEGELVSNIDKERFNISIKSCFKKIGLMNRHPDFPINPHDVIDSHDNFKMVVCGAASCDDEIILSDLLGYGVCNFYNYNNAEIAYMYDASNQVYPKSINFINSIVRPLHNIYSHIRSYWDITAQRSPAQIGLIKSVSRYDHGGLFSKICLAMIALWWAYSPHNNYKEISSLILHWTQLKTLSYNSSFYKYLYNRFIKKYDMQIVFTRYFGDHPIAGMAKICLAFEAIG